MRSFGEIFRTFFDEDVEETSVNGYEPEEYDEPIGEEYIPGDYDRGYDEETMIQPETQSYVQQPVASAIPVRSASTATVVMLSPYDIRTSQIVCDHIREGHIVICNLTPNANNQRVVDYISGAVYSLDGKIEPTPVKTTFVCTPKQVELIVGNQSGEEETTRVSAL